MPNGWAIRIDDVDYPAENLEMLRAWAREGRVKPTHYVFNPTLQRWMYARETQELSGWFGGSPSIPAGATHVCTSCHAFGKPVTRVKGSVLIELVLWLFFIIPGVIYSIWRLTSKERVCQSCGRPTIIPVRTPEGQRLLEEFS